MSRMVQALQLVAWRESRRKAARAAAQPAARPAASAPPAAKGPAPTGGPIPPPKPIARGATKWRIDLPAQAVALPAVEVVPPVEVAPPIVDTMAPEESLVAPLGAARDPTPAAVPPAAAPADEETEDVYLVEEPTVVARSAALPLVAQIRIVAPSDPFLGLRGSIEPVRVAAPPSSLATSVRRIDAIPAIELPREAAPPIVAELAHPAPPAGPAPAADPLAAFAAAGSLDVLLPMIQATNAMMAHALESLPAPALEPPVVATPPFPVWQVANEGEPGGAELPARLEVPGRGDPASAVETPLPLLGPVEPPPSSPPPLAPAPANPSGRGDWLRSEVPTYDRFEGLYDWPRETPRSALDIRFREIAEQHTRRATGAARLNLAHLDEPLAGQFRELADNLLAVTPSDRPTSVVFAACERPGELGEVLAHVARVLAAEHGQPTLLVDAQAGPQALSSRLGLASAPGWTDLLAEPASLPAAALAGIATEVPLLQLLPHGQGSGEASPEGPAAALNALCGRHRRILFDAGDLSNPALLPLARAADACFVVVRLGETDAAAAVDAVARLRAAGGRVLGCIVTNAPAE